MCIPILSGGGGNNNATGPPLYFPTEIVRSSQFCQRNATTIHWHGSELFLLERKIGGMVSECLCAGKLEFAIAEKTIYARLACLVSFSRKNDRLESH